MITYKKGIAYLGESCSVEAAEALFSWLISNPRHKVNASDCQHLHTAVLQVLLLCRPNIVAYPKDPWLLQATAGLLKE